MSTNFTIPEGYHDSFRRLLPYMEAPLHSDPQVLQSLLIYLKLGGEKMARIAIEAFNMNQRILDAEMRKQLRDQVLLRADSDESDEDQSDEDEESEDDESESESESESDEDEDDI